MKRTTKHVDLSIVPVWEEARNVFAADALPVIWWRKPRGGAGRKSRTARNHDLTKAVESVRHHVRTLEATVSELKQLVAINF
jgi:hypothetical protein